MSSDETRKLGPPLVNINTSAPPNPINSRVAVPVGDDHPLAGPTVISEERQGGESERPHATNPTSNANTTSNVGNTLGIASSQAFPPQSYAQVVPRAVPQHPTPTPPRSVPTARVVSASVSPTNSLESLADMFMSEPSYRTQELGLPPLIGPVPLPQEHPIDRIRTLVDRRAWGDVLMLATTMLTDQSDPHSNVYSSLVEPRAARNVENSTSFPQKLSQETIEVLSLRCHAWLKLRRYSDLTEEVARWNFVTHDDETVESPAWVPWSLHLIAAQTQQYTKNPFRTSDVIYALRHRIPKGQPLWLATVNNALANYFLRRGEWRLALESLDQMLQLIPSATNEEIQTDLQDATDKDKLSSVLATAYSCEVLSRQGRALMQAGALPEAEARFGTAKMDWLNVIEKSGGIPSELAHLSIVLVVPSLLDVNQGLVNFAYGDYERSLDCFRSATDELRKQESPAPKFRAKDWIGPTITSPEARHALLSECCNNMGLCALYTCRMNEAVQLMESLVREDPTAFLTERLAFNLCTLYELGYDSAASARKKRVLQLVSKRFFLHDVGPESFRVS